jgi:hypothetical protein
MQFTWNENYTHAGFASKKASLQRRKAALTKIGKAMGLSYRVDVNISGSASGGDVFLYVLSHKEGTKPTHVLKVYWDAEMVDDDRCVDKDEVMWRVSTAVEGVKKGVWREGIMGSNNWQTPRTLDADDLRRALERAVERGGAA